MSAVTNSRVPGELGWPDRLATLTLTAEQAVLAYRAIDWTDDDWPREGFNGPASVAFIRARANAIERRCGALGWGEATGPVTHTDSVAWWLTVAHEALLLAEGQPDVVDIDDVIGEYQYIGMYALAYAIVTQLNDAGLLPDHAAKFRYRWPRWPTEAEGVAG